MPETMQSEDDRLAIDGGKPAITTPLPFTPHGRELYGDEELANVIDVMRSKKLNRYELPYEESYCGRLEMALEKFLDVKHVHVTVSGSMAGSAAFRAIGIGPGDEVIIPTVTWQTVPYAIVECGAVPVVAQVDETLTLDVDDVARLVTPRTRALVPVHIHGNPANMEALLALARKHGLAVVEDACQASGGRYQGRRLGTLGDIGYFSMNCMKLMSCGDAGFVATNRDELYAFAVTYLGAHIFPNHKRVHHLKPPVIPVTQARMTELTAAVGLAQLDRLQNTIDRMRAVRDEIWRGISETSEGRRFARGPCHDPQGDCGIALSLQFKEEKLAQRFGELLRAEGVPMASSRDYWGFQSPVEVGGFQTVVDTHQPVMDQRGVWAKYWKALLEKAPLHPAQSPWTHPAYKGTVEYGPDIMARSLEKMGRIVFIRMNPRLEREHGRLIARAIRKVERALARSA